MKRSTKLFALAFFVMIAVALQAGPGATCLEALCACYANGHGDYYCSQTYYGCLDGYGL